MKIDYPFDDVYFSLVKDDLSDFFIEDEDYFSVTKDWYDLVKSFSDEIIMSYSIGDYSGDYYYIIKLKSHYGFVSVAYGSCSGCDVLQGCSSLSELKSLQFSIWKDIKWFKNLLDLKDWALEYDWEGCAFIPKEKLIDFKNIINALSG